MDKKIKYLRNKNIKDSITNMKNIEYFYYNKGDNKKQFLSSPPLMPNSDKQVSDLIEVKLDPKNFPKLNNKSPLNTINNKWFINLSNCNIPYEVQCLLQLGQNFSLPALNMNNNIIQLTKNIENNIIKLDPDTQKENKK